MKIGTKSLLFGVHQMLIHPWFVAAAWWRLYGFPWDVRLWTAFFVHDLGYWGKPDMDGVTGERHPVLGARIMGALFDHADEWGGRIPLQSRCTYLVGALCDRVWGCCPQRTTWYCFVFYHSRFLARHYNTDVSRLCAADKLATAMLPRWLYLLFANLTGEIHEYMSGQQARTPAGGRSQWQWITEVQAYLRAWAWEHRDGKPDYWTGTVRDLVDPAAAPASNRCEHEDADGKRCTAPGRAYFLDGDRSDLSYAYWYCDEHAKAGGFCYLCGQFWSGHEGFDFGPGSLWPPCREQVATDAGEYDKDDGDWCYDNDPYPEP